MIRLVHERELDATPAQVGGLIDSLASAEDRLWPSVRWPPIWFDRPLGVGAKGGHGPVRYEVSDYEPGRRVCFRFDPKTFVGHHWFEVTTRDGRTLLRHVAWRTASTGHRRNCAGSPGARVGWEGGSGCCA